MEKISHSRVAVLHVESKTSVQAIVRKAMRLANWKEAIADGKILIKINCSSDRLVPGQNTSPWVLEGVLQELKENGFGDIIVADSDTVSSNADLGSKVWGFTSVCKKYNVEFRNLTKDKTIKSKINGIIFKELPLPETLTKVDSLITVPVLHTHQITGISCSLKNQWGCIPNFRHQFHLVVDQAIVDINSFLNPKFAIADGTICMEGPGPRTGRPKLGNIILSSQDLVALDSVATKFMGFNPKQIKHLTLAHKKGLGDLEGFQLIGNDLEPQVFLPPKKNIVASSEFFFRKSFLSTIIFKTPTLNICTWIAKVYNRYWWYWLKGKKYTKEIMENTFYRKQFGVI